MNNYLIELLTSAGAFTRTGSTSSHAQNKISKVPGLLDQVREETSFLPLDVPFAQILHCITRDITSKPMCEACGSSVVHRFNSTLGYPMFCSTKCSNSSPKKKQNIADTNAVRYGGHPMGTSNTQAKRRATNMKKYGVEEIMSSPHMQAKKDATNIKRYGIKYPHLAGESNQKHQDTMIRKYGVEYPMQSSEVQQKVAATILQRYGVTSTAKLDHVKAQKIPAIRDRYEDKSAYDKLNDRNWLFEEHITKQKTPTLIANELGLKDEKSITTKLRQFSIDVIHYRPKVSLGETQVANFISTLTQVEQSNRSIIAPKELDIYVPSVNIAIEYCGLYWHGDTHKHIRYHLDKYRAAEKAGIQLITLFEDEWSSNRAVVENKLRHLVGKSDKHTVNGRACIIQNVTTSDKIAFFTANHIQGDGPSSINIGLMYAGQLVACMGFIQKKSGIFTLNRYATSHNVRGGFTKILAHFKRTHQWNTIETFADLRWSTGKLYTSTGFTQAYTIAPDYSWTNGVDRWHKFGFRHKHLSTKLKNYDPTLTEDANCRINGLWKIFDCGKIKFTLDNTIGV